MRTRRWPTVTELTYSYRVLPYGLTSLHTARPPPNWKCCGAYAPIRLARRLPPLRTTSESPSPLFLGRSSHASLLPSWAKATTLPFTVASVRTLTAAAGELAPGAARAAAASTRSAKSRKRGRQDLDVLTGKRPPALLPKVPSMLTLPRSLRAVFRSSVGATAHVALTPLSRGREPGRRNIKIRRICKETTGRTASERRVHARQAEQAPVAGTAAPDRPGQPDRLAVACQQTISADGHGIGAAREAKRPAAKRDDPSPV